jgi:hypothetical protein
LHGLGIPAGQLDLIDHNTTGICPYSCSLQPLAQMGDMAGEPKESREQREASAANTEATQREASEYWGYLFQPDKCGTPLLDRLLKGIAQVIVSWDEF